MFTRNENAMAEPPLKVLDVSVTVNTCDALMLALPVAPADGDVKLRAPLFTLKPAPERVAIILLLDGSVTLGAMATDIVTAAPAAHPRPAPDNVTISLAFDGTTNVGVNVKDIVTPVAPLITLLNVTAGALLPRDPSTIAGNVPDAPNPFTAPSASTNAQNTVLLKS